MSLVSRYALEADAIEPLSMERLAAALPGPIPWSGPERQLAMRLMYAAGDASLLDSIRIHPQAVAAGMAALRSGRPIICDVQMVAAGISRPLLAACGCELLVGHDVVAVRERARASGLPRTLEAMRYFAPQAQGAVVAIGTAPTALLALLDLIDAGAVTPALIIGMPVGYVAAAEAKDELVQRQVPYATVLGTRGGAGLAVAAVNTLLRLIAGRENRRCRSMVNGLR